MAKISDAFSAQQCAMRQVAKSSRPERVRASSKDDGRRLSSRCESVSNSSFECKNKQKEPGVLSPVFPTLQAVQGLTTSRGDVFSARGGRRRRGAAISTVRMPWPRGCSSAGRAPALQAGGQRFEPAHLHQHIDNRIGLSRSSVMRVKQNWILFLMLNLT